MPKGNSSNTSSGNLFRRDCHNGPVKLLEHKGLSLYGASVFEAERDFWDFDLVISLDHCRPSTIRSNLSSVGLQRLITRDRFTEHLVLKWPDMGVPALAREFWVELCSTLRKKGRNRQRFNKDYRVMVHCIGGHGRTGTALAIMAFMCTDEGWQDEYLLEKVRRFHCAKAVETSRQIDYVEEITGLKLDRPKGSKDYSYNKPSNKAYDYLQERLLEVTAKTPTAKSSQNRVNSFIPITEEEKEKRKMEKELQVKYFDGAFCRKHNQVACRNCKDERNGERDRLAELARLEREKELEQRVREFMGEGTVEPSVVDIDVMLEKLES